jgi:glucokinase
MFLGIDIGGTRLKAGLVDSEGRILRQAFSTLPASRAALLSTLPVLVNQVVEGDAVLAAGFGCKGIIDRATTEVLTMPGVWHFLEGLRLSETLQNTAAAGVPVAADNDAKAALAGEIAWGAARGRSNVFLLTLGTGIGGAILSDGRILRGASGAAGHLGHLTVAPDGPDCICGNRGCLEAVFSARAIEADAWSATHLGVASPMCDILRANPDSLSCRFVFEQAALGDPVARRIVERKIPVLAGAIAGLVHALDPELVIVSGSVAGAGEALFEPLRRGVAWRIRGLIKHEVPIVPSGVNDTSGIVGAAGLAAALCPPH